MSGNKNNDMIKIDYNYSNDPFPEKEKLYSQEKRMAELMVEDFERICLEGDIKKSTRA